MTFNRSQGKKIKAGLVRRMFIPCPECDKYACVHHMVCHHCDYVLRYHDLDPYREATA